ncbi:MAG: AGE family epimerase/isomerase [Pseudomonadota bacterium]
MSNNLDVLFNQAGNVWVPNWFKLFSNNEKGGFHERIDSDGSPIDLPRRLLTQCRQIIVYSNALQDNPQDTQYAAKLEEGFSFVKENYHVPETGGSIFSIDAEGKPADTKYDLYGHAFILLACAAYSKVNDNPEINEFAKTTLNFIKDNFRFEQGEGFVEALGEDMKPLPEMRRQNPHMHLMEASVYMYEASSDQDYLDMANEMLELFFDKLYDPETKTLGEFFNDDFTHHDTDGQLVEAGHHAEWVWLLKRYQEVSASKDPRITETMNDLFDFVVKHGIDPEYGGVYDEQNRDGSVVKADKRIWPGLETMRAAAIMANDDAYADQARKVVEDMVTLYQDKYIDFETGKWNEYLERDLSVKTDYRPGTTPYHIFPVLREAAGYMPKV